MTRTVGRRRLSEFWEDDTSRLSMTRLLCFLSFWPSSYVVVMTQGQETLGWYLGAYTGAYAGGKFADAFKSKGTRNARPHR